MDIDRLLDKYEDARDRGEPVSPEELCRDCPELLPELKEHIAALESLAGLLEGSAFPLDLSVAGRYRPTELHARGGLGEVYKARDDELGREVALKRTQRGDLHDRFVREAEITGRLEHPGIVPVYGLGRDAHGRPFYAMRFVRGETLDQAIARGEKRRTLLRKFGTVCEAVAYAHDRGVIHRDIKPQNIMLGPFGESLLVDWGLAKPIEESDTDSDEVGTLVDVEATQLGTRKGSPAYMSPEQARGETVGTATDVFALGATLRKILTGQPRGEFGDVPKALAAVCEKAMAEDAGGRYASALGLARDIERWLNDEPVSAWREPLTIRTRRYLKRHRVIVTGAVAALAVAAISVAILSYYQRESNIALTKSNNREAARRREAEDAAYRGAITAAQLNLDSARPESAWESLREAPPGHRAFEWHLLRRRVRAHLLRVKGYGADWHVDGDTVVLRPDMSVGLRDLEWGSLIEKECGKGLFDARPVKRDGKHLVLKNGRRFEGTDWAFSPDRKRFAYSNVNRLIVVELASGRQLYALEKNYIDAMTFSGNGARLAFMVGTSSKDVQPALAVADLDAGKGLVRFEAAKGYWPGSFRLDHTGERLVTAFTSNRGFDVFSVASGKPVHVDRTKRIKSVLFLKDGRLVTGDIDGRIRFLDESWRTLMEFVAHEDSVQDLREAEGMLVSRDHWTYKVWDARLGDGTRIPKAHADEVTGVAICGKWIVSGSKRELAIWSAADRRLHKRLSSSRHEVHTDTMTVPLDVAALATSGSRVLIGTGTWLVELDPESGKTKLVKSFKHPVRKVVVDGRRIVVHTAKSSGLTPLSFSDSALHLIGGWSTSVATNHGALAFRGDRLQFGQQLLDVVTGRLLSETVSGRPPLRAGNRGTTWDHDDTGRGYVIIYDENERELLRFVANENAIAALAIGHGYVVTGHENGDLGVWQGTE